MKYLNYYKIFESKSNIKFVKQSKKKGAKTDIYNVVKGNITIGQVKWSSRMRGYSFLPTIDCDSEIKDFVKDLMAKRRLLKKKEKVNESRIEMDISLDHIFDVFLCVKDYGLSVSDAYNGYALSMGNKDLITNNVDFATSLGNDGQNVGSVKSFTIRFDLIDVFGSDRDLYNELSLAISHIENEFNMELQYLYLRTPDGIWFRNIKSVEDNLSKLKHYGFPIHLASFLDITFRIK